MYGSCCVYFVLSIVVFFLIHVRVARSRTVNITPSTVDSIVTSNQFTLSLVFCLGSSVIFYYVYEIV